MNKNQAKEKIKKLIERHRALTLHDIKVMKEEVTKTKFIRPLFEALGWDFENDVNPEENIAGGEVDYSFKINNATKFFLEAKRLNVDLDDLEHIHQAINYAWLKSADWVILTDFEGIKVFYPTDGTLPMPALTLTMSDYIDHFDELWLLSKESFESGEFESYAERHGHIPTKIKVAKQLSLDLIKWRDHLIDQLGLANEEKPIPQEELYEGVQKILDRLIFIRTCEDRGLETEEKLNSLYRVWIKNGRKPRNFLATLNKIFQKYSKDFNSGLFDYHHCVEWDAFTDLFDIIIHDLYETRNGKRYNFADIGPDVLGAVYEQYLGHLMSESSKEESKKKRKSQGIYYTPSFIVDYIIQSSLGRYIKDKEFNDINNIKILDPACGSGSFLIRAFDYICDSYQKNLNQNKFSSETKLGLIERAFKKKDQLKLSAAQTHEILRKNIFGVDLDSQAVEITQLNLLLRAAKIKTKLPHLNNIKEGNSLIDNPKIAGDRAFDWNEEFPEVAGDGFDIIIGNPPYVRADADIPGYQQQRKWMEESDQYETLYEKWDLFVAFLERSLKLLKKNGILSFIVSESLATSKYGIKLLDWIQKNFYVASIDYFEDSKIFENVGVVPIILTIQKTDKRRETRKIIRRGEFGNIVSDIKIRPKDFLKMGVNAFRKTSEKFEFKGIINLGDICYLSKGMVINADEVSAKGEFAKDDLIALNRDRLHPKSYIEGKMIDRYSVNKIKYLEWQTDRVPSKISRKTFPELYDKPKILRGRVTGGIFDNTGIVCNDSIVVFVRFCDLKGINNRSVENSLAKLNDKPRQELEKISEKFDLKFILAIMNSKFTYRYLNNIRRHRLKNYFYPDDFRKLPIPIIPLNKQVELSKLSNKMLILNKELQSVNKNTGRWDKINSEIQKTDKLIDQKVYALYGLNKKEIEIIEEKN